MKYLPMLFVICFEITMASVFTIVYLIWHFKFNSEYFVDAYKDTKEAYKDIKK